MKRTAFPGICEVCGAVWYLFHLPAVDMPEGPHLDGRTRDYLVCPPCNESLSWPRDNPPVSKPHSFFFV